MKKYFDNLFYDSKEALCKIIAKKVKENQKMFIITANAETFINATKDKELEKILLNKDNYITADGISIIKGAKILNCPKPYKITGVELMSDMLSIANKQKSKIYLFGSGKKVLNALNEKISNKYPNVKIVGLHEGYNYKENDIFNEIKKLKPDMIFVALGIPKQEKFIEKCSLNLNKGIFIGVGGSFDVLSGYKKRAPKFFRKFNLEWLYRIIKEPKRLKRFYQNNIKFLFKINNSKKDIIFLLTIILFILLSIIIMFCKNNQINEYENRMSYQFPNFSLNTFINDEFQNKIELALSDQLPLNIEMKKTANLFKVINSEIFTDLIYYNDCNSYIPINDKIIKFGCENNLVFYPVSLNEYKKELDIMIENYNHIFNKYQNIDFYVYYIEKDTDINFETNEKNGVFDYLKNNLHLNKENINNFQINNFNDFKKYFYKTDHHWNNVGSYKGYQELTELLKTENFLKYQNQKCIDNFNGSKSLVIGGGSLLYNEDFCAYQFDISNHITKVNKQNSEYGNEKAFFENKLSTINYAIYNGDDNGLVYYDFKNPNQDNLLIIGDSFDNAISKLLASHFNKTFVVDLRNYERELNEKFSINDFIYNNKIDKVLLIGNVDFFTKEEFMIERKVK